MMTDCARFVSERIGRPYCLRTANCWHLAGEAWTVLFGRRLPAFPRRAARSAEARAAAAAAFAGWRDWREAAAPAHGALVLMSRAGCRPDVHAGVWLRLGVAGGCLHTDDPHGVVFDDLTQLRIRGFDRLRFIVPA